MSLCTLGLGAGVAGCPRESGPEGPETACAVAVRRQPRPDSEWGGQAERGSSRRGLGAGHRGQRHTQPVRGPGRRGPVCLVREHLHTHTLNQTPSSISATNPTSASLLSALSCSGAGSGGEWSGRLRRHLGVDFGGAEGELLLESHHHPLLLVKLEPLLLHALDRLRRRQLLRLLPRPRHARAHTHTLSISTRSCFPTRALTLAQKR